MHCPSCGSEVKTDWRFCLNCGNSLPGATHGGEASTTTEQIPLLGLADSEAESRRHDTAPVVDSAQTLSGRPRRHWLVISGVTIVVLVIFAAGAIVDVGVRRDLKVSRAALTSAKTDLGSTQARLQTKSADLADTKSRLQDTLDERDRLAKQVESLQTDLKGVKGSLQEAQSTVQLQSGQIQTLKTCLNGVSEALNDIVYGYYNAAINALTRVQGACDAAYALF